MLGRYGADELYKFCAAVMLILLILGFFLRSMILYALVGIIIVWCYYRFFSRNIHARAEENRIYLSCKDKIQRFFRISGLKFRDRKTHVYRKCPVCKKMLRLPKRKGNHTVNCPHCKNDFTVKIR